MPRIQVASQNKWVESSVTSLVGKSIVLPCIPFSERLKEDTQNIFEEFASDLEDVLRGYTHILEYIEDNGKMDLTRKGLEQVENLCKGMACEYVSTYLNGIHSGTVLDKMSVSQERVIDIASSFLERNMGHFTTEVANEITRLIQDGKFEKIILDEILKPLEESESINKGRYFFKNEDDMLICFDYDDWEYTCCDLGKEEVSTVGGYKINDVIVHSIYCLVEAVDVVLSYAGKSDEDTDYKKILKKRLDKKYYYDKEKVDIATFALEDIVSDDIDFMLQRFMDDKDGFISEFEKLKEEKKISTIDRVDNPECPFMFTLDISVDTTNTETELKRGGVLFCDWTQAEAIRHILTFGYSRDGENYDLSIPVDGGGTISVKNPLEVVNTIGPSLGYRMNPTYRSEVIQGEGGGPYKMSIRCDIKMKGRVD
nr:MAG TPA: hypothetical protein [Caudoviricetes sp.]